MVSGTAPGPRCPLAHHCMNNSSFWQSSVKKMIGTGLGRHAQGPEETPTPGSQDGGGGQGFKGEGRPVYVVLPQPVFGTPCRRPAPRAPRAGECTTGLLTPPPVCTRPCLTLLRAREGLAQGPNTGPERLLRWPQEAQSGGQLTRSVQSAPQTPRSLGSGALEP